MIDRFRKAPIRLQFIVLAAIPIPAVLLSAVALLPEPYIFQNGAPQQTLAVRRAQVELITNQLRNAPAGSDIETLVKSAAPAGLEMTILPWNSVGIGQERQSGTGTISDELRRVLPADFEATVLENMSQSETPKALAVRVDALRALVIRFSDTDVYPSFFGAIMELIAKTVILILPMLILVLSIASIITSPLIRFADAAKNVHLDDNNTQLFAVAGAEELRTLATSLNDMRRRIRKMIEDRTRMLTAVSHDLRTPLTRLRMRVERFPASTSKEAMLADIASLTAMIEESIQYLSSTATTEPLKKVDISSLLQTISSEFCDIGHTVLYIGPERFGYTCRKQALIRAMTNIVENAVRFGVITTIELRRKDDGGAEIIVTDDGPGLDDGLHGKVLEPFFKADNARSANTKSGFGLGLSIADDIIKGHGGSLSLKNISPHGLQVTVALPAAQVVPRERDPASTGSVTPPVETH